MAAERVMPFRPRLLDLPGGRTLEIRQVSSRDVEGLAALFESLAEEDLYRRFFQGHVPPLPVIERMASPRERGGFGLVAEIAGRGAKQIVGECSYEMLPDGDGELGITVARTARGWIGPYLLDVLLEIAAARGVPNLQADVLVENRRMLALVRARGYATIDHSDNPAIVRVLIGTRQRVPTWPRRSDRPRILVEVTGARWRAEAAARSARLQVVVCPGPLSSPPRCPAIRGQPCPLANEADVIVDAVSTDDEGGGALIKAHRRLHRGVPLCVEVFSETESPRTGFPRITRAMDDTAIVDLLTRMAVPRGHTRARPPRSDAS